MSVVLIRRWKRKNVLSLKHSVRSLLLFFLYLQKNKPLFPKVNKLRNFQLLSFLLHKKWALNWTHQKNALQEKREWMFNKMFRWSRGKEIWVDNKWDFAFFIDRSLHWPSIQSQVNVPKQWFEYLFFLPLHNQWMANIVNSWCTYTIRTVSRSIIYITGHAS